MHPGQRFAVPEGHGQTAEGSGAGQKQGRLPEFARDGSGNRVRVRIGSHCLDNQMAAKRELISECIVPHRWNRREKVPHFSLKMSKIRVV
jgi:hypothetical protein